MKPEHILRGEDGLPTLVRIEGEMVSPETTDLGSGSMPMFGTALSVPVSREELAAAKARQREVAEGLSKLLGSEIPEDVQAALAEDDEPEGEVFAYIGNPEFHCMN